MLRYNNRSIGLFQPFYQSDSDKHPTTTTIHPLPLTGITSNFAPVNHLEHNTMLSRKTILITLILPFNLALSSHAQQKKDSRFEKIAEAIAQSNQLYSKGFEKHQASLVTDRYCADGAVMAPNAKSFDTQGAILAFYNGGYDHGIRKIVFHTVKLFGFSGTFVNEEGLYELKNEQEQIMDEGKYIVVWKKTKSGWKMYRDIFNTNLNPAK